MQKIFIGALYIMFALIIYVHESFIEIPYSDIYRIIAIPIAYIGIKKIKEGLFYEKKTWIKGSNTVFYSLLY